MGTLTIVSQSSDPFSGRIEAGKLLGNKLLEYRGERAVVLGIPRGGVVVACLIADVIEADMDIVLAHKLGAPANSELAIGAVCEDGTFFVDKNLAASVGATNEYIEFEKQRRLEEMTSRVEKCRHILPRTPLKDRIVIVTDDGVATGATMQAALWAVRQQSPQKIIAALPVGPDDTLAKISKYADETLCLRCPSYFGALSRFYHEFRQVEDEELFEILEQESRKRAAV